MDTKKHQNGVIHDKSSWSSSGAVRKAYSPIPLWVRFYIYGIHGYFDETIFTAGLDFYRTGDWRLRGHSSVSTFFIYGSGGVIIEYLYVLLKCRYKVDNIVYRVMCYVMFTYVWEFITGMILRQFDACPWDYTHYKYNIYGVITLEYLPAWIIGAIIQDLWSAYLLNLYVVHTSQNTQNIGHAD